MKHLLTIIFCLSVLAVFGQVRPDQFPIETTVDANIAFYTQEDGVPRKVYVNRIRDYIQSGANGSPTKSEMIDSVRANMDSLFVISGVNQLSTINAPLPGDIALVSAGDTAFIYNGSTSDWDTLSLVGRKATITSAIDADTTSIFFDWPDGGKDTIHIIGGSGGSTQVADGQTILGDGSVGNPFTVDTSTLATNLAVRGTLAGFRDSLTAAGDVSGALDNLILGANTVDGGNIQDGSILSSDLIDNIISTNKIINSSVTYEKLSPGVIDSINRDTNSFIINGELFIRSVNGKNIDSTDLKITPEIEKVTTAPIDVAISNQPIVQYNIETGELYGYIDILNQWKKIGNESPEEIDLIILMGQSNARGTGEAFNQFYLRATDSLLIYSSNQYGFVPSSITENENYWDYGNSFGIETALKTIYPDSLGKRQLYVIKFAYDGAPIVDFMDNGRLHGKLTELLEGVINQLLIDNKIPRVWFVWMQGESDASISLNRNLYAERLDSLFNLQLRPLVGNFPIIIPQIQRATAADDTIKNETALFVNNDALADTIETLGFSTLDFDHWDSTGVEQIASALIPKLKKLPALKITRPIGDGLPITDSIFYDVSGYVNGETVPTKFFTEYNGHAVTTTVNGEKWVRIRDTSFNRYTDLITDKNFVRVDTVSYSNQKFQIQFKARKFTTAGSKAGVVLRGGRPQEGMLYIPGIHIDLEFTRTKTSFNSGFSIQNGTTANYPVELGAWNAATDRWFRITLRDSILSVDVSNDAVTWYNNRIDTFPKHTLAATWEVYRLFGGVYLLSDIDNNGNDQAMYNNISIKPLAAPSKYNIRTTSTIASEDNDTRIDVEANPNDNNIRMFVSGEQVGKLTSNDLFVNGEVLQKIRIVPTIADLDTAQGGVGARYIIEASGAAYNIQSSAPVHYNSGNADGEIVVQTPKGFAVLSPEIFRKKYFSSNAKLTDFLNDIPNPDTIVGRNLVIQSPITLNSLLEIDGANIKFKSPTTSTYNVFEVGNSVNTWYQGREGGKYIFQPTTDAALEFRNSIGNIVASINANLATITLNQLADGYLKVEGVNHTIVSIPYDSLTSPAEVLQLIQENANGSAIINQANALTIPTEGFKPIYVDSVGNVYAASTLSEYEFPDAYAIASSGGQIEIIGSAYVEVPNHGFRGGNTLFLQDDGSLDTIPDNNVNLPVAQVINDSLIQTIIVRPVINQSTGNVVSITNNYIATGNETLIVANSTSNIIEIDFIASNYLEGAIVKIKTTGADTNNITLDLNAGQFSDASLSLFDPYVISTANAQLELVWDGTNFQILE